MLSLNNTSLKAVMLLALLLLNKSSNAQNLVLNGSFESYTVNPSGCAFNFPMVNIWQQINSPDHYASSCTLLDNYGVPNNKVGVCYPINGNAYIGLALLNMPYETKEYIYQHLTNPLIAGKTYYTSFFLSKSDRSRIATKKIGAWFSSTIPVAPANTFVNAIPQVENHSGFLTDTINWVKIEGYFTAQGGEKYMTIGNFNSNANTDTLNSGTSNPIPFDNGTAYYYIDSVSLYDSLTYVTNIKQYQENIKVIVFPNPNNGNFNIEYHLTKKAEFVITDITGRLVNQYALLPSQNNFSIKEDELKAGLYFYHILVGDKTIKTDKIVIIK